MVWDFEGGIVILEQCCDLRFMSQFLKSKGGWVGEDCGEGKGDASFPAISVS